MYKSSFMTAFALILAQSAMADTFVENFQTIYTETPVTSYYAYPDDQNFIPETEFMNQDDDFDFDQNIDEVRATEFYHHPGVGFALRPMVICRNFNCTRLNDRITRNFLFNSLSQMFMMNGYSRLYICEADPFSRDCLKSGISFPVRSGIANAMVKIPKAAISQVNLSTGLSRASIGMTYTLLVNGIDRRCDQTVMDIVIPANYQATLSNREFTCNFTSDGDSSVSLLINLDYIDLDYGILGGYYSIGTQGATSGGGTGYALFKTEYSNRGLSFPDAARSVSVLNDNEPAARNNNRVNYAPDSDAFTIRPGEYAVEPLK